MEHRWTCPTCQAITANDGYNTGPPHCGDAPRAGVIGCHTSWTGHTKQHSVCCHVTFSSESADKKYHRTKTGECRTVAAMVEAGAVVRQDASGGAFVGFPAPEAADWHRGAPRSPTTAENGGVG